MISSIILICLTIYSSIPRPYMVGLEAVGVKAGIGAYTIYDNSPLCVGELAVVETRCYWHLDEGGEVFFIGLEPAHCCFSRGVNIVDNEGSQHYIESGVSSTWELITPQLGFGVFFAEPYEPLRSKCCLSDIEDKELFSPRFELSTGVSAVNLNSYINGSHPTTFLTWRNEFRVYPLRSFSLKIEHRYRPGFNEDDAALRNSVSVTVSSNLGFDICITQP